MTPLGNRLSDTKVTGTGTTAYTYPTSSHRLTKVGTARTYDAMGNMLTGTVNNVAKTFTYDVTGRMRVAKNGSTVMMNYGYNGKGEQVRRYPTTTSTEQTYEVYDEAGHWIGEYDSTGARKQEFIWLGDLPIGVYALSPGSTTAYQVYQVQADHLGTPRAVIDATRQKAVWSWPLQNEAFGKSNPVQDPDADGNTFVLDMRVPGQRYDSGSGLNYNYFRDYDSGAGRYAESDPIGQRGGIATYGYAGANPLLRVDPTGWVHWSGVYNVTSGGFSKSGVGPSVAGFDFVLKSDCVDGKRAQVTVHTLAVGFGLGASVFGPVSIGASTVSFEDHLSQIHPEVFNGEFSFRNLGTVFYSAYAPITLGGAQGDASGWSASTSMIDASSGSGQSYLMSKKFEMCQCNREGAQ
ncbi:RHS repeat-associated core domain-containing protein [Lysobacter sp. HA18]